MRFSILALTASASAAAVTPRADYGSWDFTGRVFFPANGVISMAIDNRASVRLQVDFCLSFARFVPFIFSSHVTLYSVNDPLEFTT